MDASQGQIDRRCQRPERERESEIEYVWMLCLDRASSALPTRLISSLAACASFKLILPRNLLVEIEYQSSNYSRLFLLFYLIAVPHTYVWIEIIILDDDDFASDGDSPRNSHARDQSNVRHRQQER